MHRTKQNKKKRYPLQLRNVHGYRNAFVAFGPSAVSAFARQGSGKHPRWRSPNIISIRAPGLSLTAYPSLGGIKVSCSPCFFFCWYELKMPALCLRKVNNHDHNVQRWTCVRVRTFVRHYEVTNGQRAINLEYFTHHKSVTQSAGKGIACNTQPFCCWAERTGEPGLAARGFN